MTHHRIAIVVGSLRRDSINRKIAQAIAKAAGDRLDCRFVEIGDLPLFSQDLEASPPEQWVRFRDEIAAADAVLFATPEYNRSVPGVLKNAIDVGSRPYGQSKWAGKPAAIVSASPGAIGGFGANHHLRQSCVFLDMPVMQQPEAYLGHVGEAAFNADGSLAEGPLKEVVGKFALAFVDWVERLVPGPTSAVEDADPPA